MAKKGDKKKRTYSPMKKKAAKPPKKKVVQGHTGGGEYSHPKLVGDTLKRISIQSGPSRRAEVARATERYGPGATPYAQKHGSLEASRMVSGIFMGDIRAGGIAQGQKAMSAGRSPAPEKLPDRKSPPRAKKVKPTPKKAKPAAGSPRARLATAKKKQADKRSALLKRGAAVRAKRNKKNKK
jgi:hypothetical protein|tara:strand:- start:356 stop:901 length:546 start_codon:yes stop_codon:yes gene_type:complete